MPYLKKTIACLLTLCLLIGMPLSLNVTAADSAIESPTQQTARLVQALLIPVTSVGGVC